MPDDLLTREARDAVEVRAEAEGDGRTIDLRLVPWDTWATTPQGRESFARGAFTGVDPARVTVEGGGHGMPLVGRGVAIEERDDGAYLSARIAPTPAGDDVLTLAREGVYRDASVSFLPVEGGTRRTREGLVRERVDLRRVAVLERGAYAGAEVLAVRGETEDLGMDEPTTALVEAVPDARIEALYTRVDAIARNLETRTDVPLPTTAPDTTLDRGEWLYLAAGAMAGDPASMRTLQERALADSVMGSNAGVVPSAIRAEMLGIVNASRPFLNSTRRVPAPEYGTKLIMPVIGQRPLVGVQAAEKTEVASRNVTTTTSEWGMSTYAGAGDVSYQLIRRSSPSFSALFLDLLAEAYAQTTDGAGATIAFANAQDGGAATIADFATYRGEAVLNTIAAVNRYPDTIWLSRAALGLFLNAKDSTGRPLYPALGPTNALGTATSAGAFTVDGLSPVIVPSLATGFAIGWSGSFAWAEDGTYQITVDRADVLGRDTALYGFLWFAPIYPLGITKFGPVTMAEEFGGAEATRAAEKAAKAQTTKG